MSRRRSFSGYGTTDSSYLTAHEVMGNDLEQEQSSINVFMINGQNDNAVGDPGAKNTHVDQVSRSYGQQILNTETYTTSEVGAGDLNLLSEKFESLDYDTSENLAYKDTLRCQTYRGVMKLNFLRWIVVLIIGVLTAIIASMIDMSIETIASYKYGVIKKYMDKNAYSGYLIVPYLLWIVTNGVPVFIAAALVCYVEPVAIGSGIPQIKCYLNGIKIPRVVRIKTLLCKAVGVTLSVLGGLAIGKEGPMIHSGAVIAAGLSQGKSTSLKRDFKIFNQFRNDKEKRDFVSAGAAAGVSAAFGAPVGGVLFSLEEGASFWNQSLTWRMFFGSMVSTFTLNLILSAYHGKMGQLSYSGLLNFGEFDNIVYSLSEFPIYFFMGLTGGVLGALFNHINYKLSVFRLRYLNKNWLRVAEAVLVSIVSASAGFIMIYSLNDCKPIDRHAPVNHPVKLHCDDGYYNSLAVLWFQTPEEGVRSLFHDNSGSFDAISIFIFFVVYFLLSTWTYGVHVPSGLFIPCLLTGAAWGRLVGIFIHHFYPTSDWADPGKFALIGAAAQLGGVVRMTISLTVILIEATGNITFGLPIMIVLMIAKWMGDFFNEGLYDIHIQLTSIPILPWEPPPLAQKLFASEIMSHPVITLKTIESVSKIVNILKYERHNAFPVVDEELGTVDSRTFGRFRGLILRSDLIILLKHKVFNETADSWAPLTLDDFIAEYPRYTQIQQVHVSNREMDFTIDLRPHMNPSAYTVCNGATLPRIFRLFRAIGLRHIVVIDDAHNVIGIVTRKDIARFRAFHHHGIMGIEELKVAKA